MQNIEWEDLFGHGACFFYYCLPYCKLENGEGCFIKTTGKGFNCPSNSSIIYLNDRKILIHQPLRLISKILVIESTDPPLISQEAAAILTTTGLLLTLAVLAPPPLPLFPPQGVAQPGSVTSGGGALPSSVFAVGYIGINITWCNPF